MCHSAQTLFESMSGMEDLCCSTKCCGDDVGHEDTENEPCSGKLCNPFHACGACVILFTAGESLAHLSIPPVNKSPFASAGKFFYDLRVFDVWHPPQIS